MRFVDKLPFAAHRARLASRAPRVGVAARAAEIDGMIRTAWLMSDAVVARACVTTASGTDGTFSGHVVHYFWPIVIRQSVHESRQSPSLGERDGGRRGRERRRSMARGGDIAREATRVSHEARDGAWRRRARAEAGAKRGIVRFKSVTRAMTSRADARGDGRTRDRCMIRGRRAFDARARDDERTDEDATVDRMRTTCARR